mgnify:CR=1 FL=1
MQAATENERVCRRFLSDLVERGLQYESGLLVVIDGGKGLYKAVMSVLKGHACVQRCQYHKRQNVVSYLSKSEQSGIGRKMEAAYGQPTYEAGKAALAALKPGLKLMNQSALHSLEEGMEDELWDAFSEQHPTARGVKLGGWPSLVQSEIYWAPQNEHPADPKYVLQIDSLKEARWQWGQDGCAYLGRGTAKGRQNEWAFEWQCL